MRLVYFGAGEFGLPTLQRLLTEHDVVLAVTQPDRPAGRSRRTTPTAIARFADSKGIDVIKPDRPNEPDVIEQIRSRQAEGFVVIAYGHKLSEALLGETFAINLHASLLPKYRGAAPINWAMINGEEHTGLSVITLSQTMDAGSVLASSSTSIDPMETAGELHDRLAEMGPEVILRTLDGFTNGALEPIVQDASLACRAPKMSKADGTVDFDRPANAVRCRVHGLTPWPGCTVTIGDQRLKVLRVQVVEETDANSREPGEILTDCSVACNPGVVKLLSVQPPGGKAMTFEAYCNGRKVHAGARLLPL